MIIYSHKGMSERSDSVDHALDIITQHPFRLSRSNTHDREAVALTLPSPSSVEPAKSVLEEPDPFSVTKWKLPNKQFSFQTWRVPQVK